MPDTLAARRRRPPRILRDKAALAAIALITLLLAVVVAGPWFAPYGENEMLRGKSLQPPNGEHWLGTDNFGRDVFSRVVYGARVSILVGLGATLLATVAGTVWGVVAGYFGGWFDDISNRIFEIMLAFPYIVLAMALVVVVGPGTYNVVLIIALIQMPEFARLIRSAVLSIREMDFVEAAGALGSTHTAVLVRHVIPNAIAPIMVMSSLAIAVAINIEAALSFLGLGVTPPLASWGNILADGRSYIWQAPWIATSAGLVITASILGFNLLGDSMRDYLDPHTARN